MIETIHGKGSAASFPKRLLVLWRFSRPHTIIGSVFSITALYILAGKGSWPVTGLYFLTLLAALACNVFIVGLNQYIDVELDKVNKPELPLAAGTLSARNAQIILAVSLLVCLGVSAWVSMFLLLMMVVILFIGIAYSVPPIQLKKHHLPAALAITLVRGFIVNLGMFLHFQRSFSNSNIIPGYAWCLTLFIMAFSVAIAWFKDIPDTEGDNHFRVKTLAVLYSRKLALRGGMLLVTAAYMYVIIWSWLYAAEQKMFLVFAHALLLCLFLLNYLFIRLNEKPSIRRFYIRFWMFFFAEYTVFAVWGMMMG